MHIHETLTEAIEELREEGYLADFNVDQDYIVSHDGVLKLFSNDFKVDKFYRFEENTDPSEQAIIYALSSEKYDIKGILVNGYGIYSDPVASELAEKFRLY